MINSKLHSYTLHRTVLFQAKTISVTMTVSKRLANPRSFLPPDEVLFGLAVLELELVVEVEVEVVVALELVVFGLELDVELELAELLVDVEELDPSASSALHTSLPSTTGANFSKVPQSRSALLEINRPPVTFSSSPKSSLCTHNISSVHSCGGRYSRR